MCGDGLIVQLLSQDKHSSLWIQMEMLEAVWMETAVDGVDQPAVGVCVLGTDL